MSEFQSLALGGGGLSHIYDYTGDWEGRADVRSWPPTATDTPVLQRDARGCLHGGTALRSGEVSAPIPRGARLYAVSYQG